MLENACLEKEISWLLLFSYTRFPDDLVYFNGSVYCKIVPLDIIYWISLHAY
jgi:hypothetical protein